MTLISIIVRFIHPIKTPELQHLFVSFLFILECLNEIFTNFNNAFYSVIIRGN